MPNLSKRLLLAGAVPFALAAVYGGSIAFAQSSEPTPTTDGGSTQQDDTTTPTLPGHKGNSEDCPGKGGSGEDGTNGSDSSMQTRTRARHGAQPATAAY